MEEQSDLQKLKQIRNSLAVVYKSQVMDDIHDNGNLSTLNESILSVESVIKELEQRQ